jgi:hypothetical protein
VLALIPAVASAVRQADARVTRGGRPVRRSHPSDEIAFGRAPSWSRVVHLDDDGRPVHVEMVVRRGSEEWQLEEQGPPPDVTVLGPDPASGHADNAGELVVKSVKRGGSDLVAPHSTPLPSPGAGPAADVEGTCITRYPVIDVVHGEVGEVGEVGLVIDLALSVLEAMAADPIRFAGLADDWSELSIAVRVTSPQLAFADGEDEGTIRVRRDRPSVKCRLSARRRPDATGPLEITATFFHRDRWCGTAQRTFAAGATRADPPPPPSVAPPSTVAISAGARAPDLTVHIHRTEADRRRLVWLLAPAAAHRAHVRRASAESSLDDEPGPYVRALFREAARSRPGEHVSLLHGIGERLWALAPPAFHDAYWAMRDALGDGFTIQFLTDEPHLPWELMRPVRRGAVTRLIGETHPVARGLLAYPDRLRPILPARGAILTMAPDYAKRASRELPPLIAAGEESAMLRARFAARPIAPASARRMLDALVDREQAPVKLLHFAGHGRLETPIERSRIACEDGDVTIAQVRRQDTVLGERHATFVVFNACEAGATGEVLGEVGGWAEAFAYREFSGFVAPLWAVFDDHAWVAMERFFVAVLEDGRPVGEALRDMRAAHGPYSPTALSYVYYGDVNARFA